MEEQYRILLEQANKDVETLCQQRDYLITRNAALERSVLNQCGDNLCHLVEIPIQIPPRAEFLESCRRYHAQIAGDVGELQAGQMTIAQLEAEVAWLRGGLADSGKSRDHE